MTGNIFLRKPLEKMDNTLNHFLVFLWTIHGTCTKSVNIIVRTSIFHTFNDVYSYVLMGMLQFLVLKFSLYRTRLLFIHVILHTMDSNKYRTYTI